MKFYTNIQTLGNKVLHRGVDTEKGDYIRRDEFRPTMFVNRGKGETKYKSLAGDPVYKIKPGDIYETRDFIKQYDGVGGFEVHGNDNFALQYTCVQWPEQVEYDVSKVRVWNIDIEVESDNGFPHADKAESMINAITVYDNIDDTYYTWALNDWEQSRDDIIVQYFQLETETQLLSHFLEFWQRNTPHVLTGWNIEFFDVPYIMNRYARLFGAKEAKKFSPFGYVKEQKKRVRFGKEVVKYNIYGVEVLDYLQLYQKFTYSKQESYKLDHIAHVELGERKISYEEAGSLLVLARTNHQKFIDYNIKDVELVKRLDDKMKLLDLAMTMAYDAKINFEDVFGTVKMWDSIIYDYLRKKGVVAPPKEFSDKDEKYGGAYVKDPITGFHDWIVSFDLNSLYPHLIMQYNISPDTLVGHMDGVSVDKLLNREVDTSKLQQENVTVAPNGSVYTREKRGFLPELMEKIYKERKVFKRKMLDAQQAKENGEDTTNDIAKYNNIQMAKKIQLNSAYGALGNAYFRYYDIRNATAITSGGQLSIRWIEKKLNGFLNKIRKTEGYDYVVAIDTDSVYLRLNRIVDDVYEAKSPTTQEIVHFLDKVCKNTIEPFIDDSYDELAKYVNAYDQKMQMGREAIAERGIWTAKKRYALNVWNNEGVQYAKPKMKVMGLEIVKSSTPQNVRDKLKEAVAVMLSSDEAELQKLVADYRKEFNALPPEDIAFPRGVTDYKKYIGQVKKVPIHVKSSQLYNKLLKQHGLTTSEPIDDGAKVKFIYLKTPNPHQTNAIAMINGFPPEFDIEKWIDFDTQFEKSFLKPLQGLLTPVGWNYEKKSTLEDFFA